MIELDLVFSEDTTFETLDTLLDALAEATADIQDGIDGDVSLNFALRTMTIHLSLDDESDEKAFARGLAAARTAVHASGGPTPGWEKITLQPTADGELTPA